MQKPKAVAQLTEVFDELRAAGFVLGVATNDVEAAAHAHMSHLGVVDHFDLLIGSDSVSAPKPHGNMIRLFCEKIGLQPHEIAMVGDNAHDMNEARAGGAGLAIGVLSGNSTSEDLEPLADHIIHNVGHLPALMKRLR